jgi:DNA invertase Pin-like site-specific DNA recombinase
MLVGYARVSTYDQNLDLQKDDLTKAGCEKIFLDTVSGVASERPGMEQAFEYIREGDTLVVWRLDRLGRSLKHLIELIGCLDERGIGFKSLQESIDTTTSGGKLVFHIFGALAEFERNLIKDRTIAGLAAAKSRGRMGGRPRVFDQQKMKAALKLYEEREQTVQEICNVMGISKATFYNYVHRSPVKAKR